MTGIITDEIIYKRYWTGESDDTVDQLVEKYGDMLTFYINGYIKDIHEAEDLMIEAFSRVFAKERPVEGNGSFKAYLYKTARNLALRHKRKYRIFFLHIDDLNFEPPSEAFTDMEIIRNERDQQIYRALDKLKLEYREALYLVYFENMSYRSAARVMFKSEQQIKNLVHRGKKSLRKNLEREGFIYADE